MPANVAGLRYPYTRVLLPRTRLAYVHLRNLLTDAKRDRSARISGYVAIWLPEEFVVLYLVRGELVNACVHDGRRFSAVPVVSALEMIPAEPEYGEICFHEGDPELLSCMFTAQTTPADPWPTELRVTDPSSLFPYLMSTTFDGVLEIACDGAVNYLVFQDGAVVTTHLASNGMATPLQGVKVLFEREHRALHLNVRRWQGPLVMLPEQAASGLVAAYRDLTAALVARLVADGRDSAPAIAEHARVSLLSAHPALEAFSFAGRPGGSIVLDSASLTDAVAALINDVLWTTTDHDGAGPEQLLRDITWDRRHLFASSGLYDRLSWKLT